jgi:TorA maturation chaperone TorD
MMGNEMQEMDDRELFRVRLLFLDLVKSFFVEQPDAEILARWRGTFSALKKEQVSPRFDSAATEIARALDTKTLEELQDEYYALFTDPFGGSTIEMTASFYNDGKSYAATLAELRGMLHEVGVAKDDTVSDPEDSLVVMLDFFATLIEEEKKSGEEKWKEFQAKMLKEYLEPTAANVAAALKEHEKADFYYLCSRVLEGYLDLEKGLAVSV